MLLVGFLCYGSQYLPCLLRFSYVGVNMYLFFFIFCFFSIHYNWYLLLGLSNLIIMDIKGQLADLQKEIKKYKEVSKLDCPKMQTRQVCVYLSQLVEDRCDLYFLQLNVSSPSLDIKTELKKEFRNYLLIVWMI